MQSNVEKIKQYLSLRPSYQVIHWFSDGSCCAVSNGPQRPSRYHLIDTNPDGTLVKSFKIMRRHSTLKNPHQSG